MGDTELNVTDTGNDTETPTSWPEIDDDALAPMVSDSTEAVGGIPVGEAQRAEVAEATIIGMTKEEFDAKVQEANPVQEAPRKKKVAILGFTESWKLAPFDDPEYEIWGLNELYLFIPRWTRWFEIHKREVYEADKNRTDDHLGKLRQMTVPIYMHQHWDDIPMSVSYPLDTIIQNFGPYLTNSISYMIALAILEGFEEIGIYGVDMAHDTEYGSQRPSCEYFVGIATGRGIKVIIPDQADLMKSLFLYGYQEEQQGVFFAKLKSRKQELEQKHAQIEQQLAQLEQQKASMIEARAQYRGALQDVDHIMKIWAPTNSVTLGMGGPSA